jgi:hypothetical protein
MSIFDQVVKSIRHRSANSADVTLEVRLVTPQSGLIVYSYSVLVRYFKVSATFC